MTRETLSTFRTRTTDGAPRRLGRVMIGAALIGSLALVVADGSVQAAPGDIELVSKSTAGVIGDDDSGLGFQTVDMSDDGRYVLFVSDAQNLVEGDTNNMPDVFRRDLQTGETIRVSTTATGAQAEGGRSAKASISGDGRYVAFESQATNLVPAAVTDTNDPDVFVKDLTTGAVDWISSEPLDLIATTDRSGGGSPQISADGKKVVYLTGKLHNWAWGTSAPQNATVVMVRDLETRSFTVVNSAPGGGVPLNGTVGAIGSHPDIDADGDTVVWESRADNLVPGDVHGDVDAFVHTLSTVVTNLSTGVTVMASTNAAGEPMDNLSVRFSSIDNAGSKVAFESTYTILGDDLVDGGYYVRDLTTGALTDPFPLGEGGLGNLSGDGKWLVAWGTGLGPAGTAGSELYLAQLDTGRIRQVTRRADGVDASGHAEIFTSPALSFDAGHIAFGSRSKNLVDGDDNLRSDAFVVERPTFGPEIVSVVPARLVETRDGPGLTTVDGLFEGIDRLAAGSTTPFDIAGRGGIDATGVSAAVINVTAINPEGRGFVTVFPCGDRPLASSLNFSSAGAVVGNELIAKLSPTGTVCVYTSAETHLTIDAVGLVPSASPLNPLSPGRVLETRSGEGIETIDGQFEGAGPIEGDTFVELDLTGRAGIPLSDVEAVVMNVTAINPEGRGFITVYPCGERPTASSLNFSAAGAVVGNELIAKLSDDGSVCIYASRTTNLTVDAVGYLASGALTTPLDPARILETREAPGLATVDGLFLGIGPVVPSDTLVLDVTGRGGVPGAGVGSVIVNITAINPAGRGFLTVYPCGVRPLASSLNFSAAGAVVGNELVAKVSPEGNVCIYASTPTSMTADVVGYVPLA